MRPSLLACTVVAGLALSACAPMEWVRPDTAPEQAKRDGVDCQQAAWREARSRDWFHSPYGPWPYRDVFGRRMFWPYNSFGYPFDDPYLEEARLAQFCMRNKGYELREVSKAR